MIGGKRYKLHILTALLALLLAADAALIGGCESPAQTSGPQLAETVYLEEVQGNLMAFADTYTTIISQAASDLEDRSDPNVRLEVHRWKSRLCISALATAIKPNPVVGVVDITAMAVLSRDSLERHLGREVFGDDEEILLSAARRAEREAWVLAKRVLTPSYVVQLEELIQEWRQDHPTQWEVSFVRLENLGRSGLYTGTVSGGGGGSILGLLMIDPFAGLDPATRELERARLLGERMFYFAARTPLIMTWTSDGFLYKTAAMPESQRLLMTANRLTGVTEQIGRTVDQLPDTIATQSDATIDAMMTGIEEQRAGIAADLDTLRENIMLDLTAQRAALLADIDGAQGNLQGTLAEMRQTIEAGTELSALLESTVKATDALTTRMAENRDPDAEPMDMAQVETLLAETTTTVRELNTLVASLDQLLLSPEGGQRFTEIEQMIAAAEASSTRVVNRAFMLLIVLVGMIFVAAVAKSFIRPRAVAGAN